MTFFDTKSIKSLWTIKNTFLIEQIKKELIAKYETNIKSLFWTLANGAVW